MDTAPHPNARVEAAGHLLDAVTAADRVIAIATAAKYRLLDLARRACEDAYRDGSTAFATDMIDRQFRAEAALALRIPERTADHLIEQAQVLVEELPATLAALGDGVVTPRQAVILVEETRELESDDRAILEARALKETHRSSGDFCRKVRGWRERRTPEAATVRARTAFTKRGVWVDPGRDGMVWFSAQLPAPEGVAIDARLTATATALHAGGDKRTLQQLRADLLTDLLLSRDSDATNRFEGIKPTVVLTIPADTLMRKGDGGGDLDGYGPLDPETTRLLASVAPEFRRMLTDPHTGAPLSLGRERYRPSADLRLWLRIRDEYCRFPGCTRRVTTCDIDHVCDWAHGGCTDPDNLAHLCRTHHMLKHQTPFQVKPGNEHGVLDWTTPLGRRYQTRPPGTDPP